MGPAAMERAHAARDATEIEHHLNSRIEDHGICCGGSMGFSANAGMASCCVRQNHWELGRSFLLPYRLPRSADVSEGKDAQLDHI